MYESNKRIQEMALAAGKKAVDAAKANKVPITYLVGDKVVRELPNGNIEVLGAINNTSVDKKRFSLK